MTTWNRKRKIILERDKKCVKCGSTDNLTIDHIVPLVRGGGNELSNLQTLCATCNNKKGWRIDWKWLDRVIMALHVDDHLEKIREENVGWRAGLHNQMADRIKSIIGSYMGEFRSLVNNQDKIIAELNERIRAMEAYHDITFHKEVPQTGVPIVQYNKVKVLRKKRAKVK